MSAIKVGDRVKVEYEGTVTDPGDRYVMIRLGNADGVAAPTEFCTVIVPLDPPYVPQVGDIVRVGKSPYVFEVVEVNGATAILAGGGSITPGSSLTLLCEAAKRADRDGA